MTTLGAQDDEYAVLTTCLLHPTEAIPLVAETVKAKHFHSEPYRRIYAAIATQWEQGRGVDLISVGRALDADGPLLGIAPAEFLTDLLGRAEARLDTVVDHAREVRSAALRRQLQRAGVEITAVARDESLTYDDCISRAQRLLDEIEDCAVGGPVPVRDVVERVFAEIDAGKVGGAGVETGFPELDGTFGQLEPGAMVVVAARPSVGKTTFAQNVSANAAGKGKRVLVFSLEVPSTQFVRGLLSNLGSVDSMRLRPGALLTDEDFRRLGAAAEAVAALPIAIDDRSSLSPLQIRAAALRHRALHKSLDLVVIDYLGLLDAGRVRTRGSTRNDEVGWLSAQVKAIARDLEVPVLLLAQLNRESTKRPDGRPVLSDLRDSGCVEQDADVVLLLHRQELVESDPARRREAEGRAEVIVAKNRHGPTGVVTLSFEGRCCRFKQCGTERF